MGPVRYGVGPVIRPTRGGPVVGLLVGGSVDELAHAGDGVGAHEGVAAECPTVHHPDVERGVEQLVLREVLQRAG